MWWVALALAGEPKTIASPPTLPAGVTRAPTARELVQPLPAGVTFTVAPSPELRDGVLVFRGVLENTTSRAAKVVVASQDGTGGPFLLVPRGVVYVPDPSDPPPAAGVRSPMEFGLPAGARVPFEAGLRIDRWAWPEGGGDVDVDWTFDFWSTPVKGSVGGRLQPRKTAPQGG